MYKNNKMVSNIFNIKDDVRIFSIEKLAQEDLITLQTKWCTKT